jgi:hypothetical protein
MKGRRNIRQQILRELARVGSITSIYKFAMDCGCYDYSYALGQFRKLQIERRITMNQRLDMQGKPWIVTPGPRFRSPLFVDQPTLGEIWNHKTSH